MAHPVAAAGRPLPAASPRRRLLKAAYFSLVVTYCVGHLVSLRGDGRPQAAGPTHQALWAATCLVSATAALLAGLLLGLPHSQHPRSERLLLGIECFYLYGAVNAYGLAFRLHNPGTCGTDLYFVAALLAFVAVKILQHPPRVLFLGGCITLLTTALGGYLLAAGEAVAPAPARAAPHGPSTSTLAPAMLPWWYGACMLFWHAVRQGTTWALTAAAAAPEYGAAGAAPGMAAGDGKGALSSPLDAATCTPLLAATGPAAYGGALRPQQGAVCWVDRRQCAAAGWAAAGGKGAPSRWLQWLGRWGLVRRQAWHAVATAAQAVVRAVPVAVLLVCGPLVFYASVHCFLALFVQHNGAHSTVTLAPMYVLVIMLSAFMLGKIDLHSMLVTLTETLERQRRVAEAKHQAVQAMKEEIRSLESKQSQLLHERAKLQSEHERMSRQQCVLQAGLEMTLLNTHKQHAIIDVGTPAERMLALLQDILEGVEPSIDEALWLHSVLRSGTDIHNPVDIQEQMQRADMDAEVAMALLQELGREGWRRASSGHVTTSYTRPFFSSARSYEEVQRAAGNHTPHGGGGSNGSDEDTAGSLTPPSEGASHRLDQLMAGGHTLGAQRAASSGSADGVGRLLLLDSIGGPEAPPAGGCAAATDARGTGDGSSNAPGSARVRGVQDLKDFMRMSQSLVLGSSGVVASGAPLEACGASVGDGAAASCAPAPTLQDRLQGILNYGRGQGAFDELLLSSGCAGVVPPLRRSTSIARHSNGHRVPNYRRCSITAPLGLGPLLVSQPSPSTAGDSSAQCTACTSATVASAAATCISSRDFSSTQPASASPVQSAPQSPPHLLPDCTAVAADASTIVCLGSPHVRPCPERMSPHGNGALPIFCAPAETAAGLHLAAGAGLDDTCDDPCSRAPPPPPLLDEVEQQLVLAMSSWQFDCFSLDEVTGGHPLSALGYYCLHRTGLITDLKLDGGALARFLCTVENRYRPNPYHNRTHAADVLHSMHVLLTHGGLSTHYANSPGTRLACYLAAVVHDFEHVGLTNDFLIDTCDVLAVTYNDKAPMENHHLAASFRLLRRRDLNFMSRVPKEEQGAVRKTVIDLVLATDMKQHWNIIAHFNLKHRVATAPSNNTSTDKGQLGPMLAAGAVGSTATAYASAVGEDAAAAGEVVPNDDVERLLGLQMAIKCADLGHLTAPLSVHLRWVEALQEELWRQGDAERDAGLAVSPLFDRHKSGITKSQVGFFDVVAIPLFRSFSDVFTASRPLLNFMLWNYNHWCEQQKQQQ